MLIRVILAASCAAMFLATTSCYSAPVMPPAGVIFSNIEAPLAPAGNPGSRKGEASCSAVLGIIAWGDCSVKAAAEAGGISMVKHTDYEFFNVLIVYQQFTTVVYGD